MIPVSLFIYKYLLNLLKYYLQTLQPSTHGPMEILSLQQTLGDHIKSLNVWLFSCHYLHHQSSNQVL